MIVFEKIRYKNFLATGNQGIEVKFNEVNKTFVKGKNGHGKSTFGRALTFALFGKTLEGVKKDLLPNKINGKDCVVELEFVVGAIKHKIVRGIKPNIFEIWVDGKKLEEDSKMLDQQKFLEKSILRFNIKNFAQRIYLSNTIPFMMLAAAERRAMVENLLGIEVFSVMNSLAKTKLADTKLKVQSGRLAINSCDDNISTLSKVLSQQNMVQQHDEDKIRGVIEESESAIVKINETIAIREKVKFSDVSTTKLNELKSQFNYQIKDLDSKILFLKNNTACPTCKQKIDEDFREQTLIESKEKHANLTKKLEELSVKLKEKEVVLREKDKFDAETRILQNKLIQLDTIIRIQKSHLSVKVVDNTNNNKIKQKIEELRKQKIVLDASFAALIEQENLDTIAISMLKDDSIKTRIIKKHLPTLNALINKYLKELNFFATFEFNEEFEEVLKSRGRDELSYANFSAGEKMRVDMAIRFAWRDMAKKTAGNTSNLLIMDETFDSSLDNDGVSDLLTILDEFKDMNLFVISHKNDSIDVFFDRTILFEKERGYSKLVLTEK